jgi:hypothetical protein
MRQVNKDMVRFSQELKRVAQGDNADPDPIASNQ